MKNKIGKIIIWIIVGLVLASGVALLVVGNILPNGNVLRTQTSAVQVRAMEKNGVPIKMFTVGQCYRKELDATHSAMFGQIEGLYVDKIEKSINLSDM